MAQTPTLDALKAAGPRRYRLLKAHGTAVGLPSDGDMGNSEVGAGCLPGLCWHARSREGGQLNGLRKALRKALRKLP